MKYKATFLIFTLLFLCAKSIASDNMSSENTIFCHGCSDAVIKNKALDKAKEIGLQAPEMEPIRPTTVYVYDYKNRKVTGIDVYNSYDLHSAQPYTVYINPSLVSFEVQKAWDDFVGMNESFFNNPFHSDISGYDFLKSVNVRHQVFNDVKASWYRWVLASAQALQLVDSIIGILPDDIFIERLTISFSDDVKVTVSLVDADKQSLVDLFSVYLEYDADTAYLIDENGQRIKIPDDYREAIEPTMIDFESVDKFEEFTSYMSRFGFRLSGGQSDPVVTGPTGVYCTVDRVESTPATDDKPATYSYKYTCVRG